MKYFVSKILVIFFSLLPFNLTCFAASPKHHFSNSNKAAANALQIITPIQNNSQNAFTNIRDSLNYYFLSTSDGLSNADNATLQSLRGTFSDSFDGVAGLSDEQAINLDKFYGYYISYVSLSLTALANKQGPNNPITPAQIKQYKKAAMRQAYTRINSLAFNASLSNMINQMLDNCVEACLP